MYALDHPGGEVKSELLLKVGPVDEKDSQGVEDAVQQAAGWCSFCPPGHQHYVIGQGDEEDGQWEEEPHSQGEGLVQSLPFSFFKWHG